MATLTTNHGTFTGRTPESIIRREYGRDAYLVLPAYRDATHAGRVARTDLYGVHALATVHSFERAEVARPPSFYGTALEGHSEHKPRRARPRRARD